MKPNPYESKTGSSRSGASSGFFIAAALCFLLAVAGLLATILTMNRSFEATVATPSPQDLAQGISLSLLPAMAAIPLFIAGIVCLLLGWSRRREA